MDWWINNHQTGCQKTPFAGGGTYLITLDFRKSSEGSKYEIEFKKSMCFYFKISL